MEGIAGDIYVYKHEWRWRVSRETPHTHNTNGGLQGYLVHKKKLPKKLLTLAGEEGIAGDAGLKGDQNRSPSEDDQTLSPAERLVPPLSHRKCS